MESITPNVNRVNQLLVFKTQANNLINFLVYFRVKQVLFRTLNTLLSIRIPMITYLFKIKALIASHLIS